MDPLEQTQHDQAALYARIIVGWHARMGASEWRRLYGHQREDRYVRYQHIVAKFRDSDLTDRAVQAALANEQIAGAMEWAYMMPVAEEAPGLNQESRNLGGIARRLQELASRPVEHERLEDAGRKVVRFSDEQDLLAQAASVYSGVAGPNVQGAGGTSFLLSCSLERSEQRGSGEIVLLSPGILGASPAPRGRESDLLEQLGSGGLEILDVTGI